MSGVGQRRLWRSAALPALLLGLACGGPVGDSDSAAPSATAPGVANGERRNVLLITVDTLRADRLGCYGYRLDTSPTIDALADGGVRFVDATVQWPKTWPSLASMLSGRYPKTTGIQYTRKILPESMVMLSDRFGESGYRTAAVVANFNVGKTFGFDQGFEHFVESWAEKWAAAGNDEPFQNAPGRVKEFTDARTVVDQGLSWLRESDDGRPFFLWLHFMDPHGPYVPPPGYEELFVGEHPAEPVALELLPSYQLQLDGAGEPIADLGFYRAQYDREVRYLDDELSRLFQELEPLAPAEGTVVALSADHGESFREHEYYLEHGQFSYQPSARVPLIVRAPGMLPAGRVIEPPVGLIDLAPTLSELAGIEGSPSFEGTSLVPWMRGDVDAAPPTFVFMESGYDVAAPQHTVRFGRWKLIHVRSPHDLAAMTGAQYELYDLEADPGELRNLADEQGPLVAQLASLLLRWYASGPSPEEAGEPVDLEALDPKAIEMLRSLGYLGD